MSLLKIQSELKAPKNQKNEFGGYKYRSCEDILEAVKPLLAKYNCQLYISDSIEAVCDRVYVCANVKFTWPDEETSEYETVEVKAYAREPESKKGMDESQITGSSSSYARKYALNGLFLIDDVKDADTQDNTKIENKTAEKKQPVKESMGGMTSDQCTEFYQVWNGKLYGKNKDTVYWNDNKYTLSDAQIEWFKNQPKYKES